MKKFTVITGHYGAGKSNISANLAVKLADAGKKAAVIDMDIVNPYFRTADLSELFESRGITLAAPEYANSNLDIPVLNFDLEQLAAENEYVIADVGGDDAGAVAIGKYSRTLEAFGENLDMLYVINQYRYLTGTPEDAVAVMREIENAARIRHTGIINNSNLGFETTDKDIENSVEFAEKISEISGLPLIFNAYMKGLDPKVSPKTEVEVYVRPLWEIY